MRSYNQVTGKFSKSVFISFLKVLMLSRTLKKHSLETNQIFWVASVIQRKVIIVVLLKKMRIRVIKNIFSSSSLSYFNKCLNCSLSTSMY